MNKLHKTFGPLKDDKGPQLGQNSMYCTLYLRKIPTDASEFGKLYNNVLRLDRRCDWLVVMIT